MYPYNLSSNPYPSSPTPTLQDATVLGGKRHKEAKEAIIECIEELKEKISSDIQGKDFRLITVIQDVGAGKTHLSLHIKSTRKDIACSYIDLSTISPRGLPSLYSAVMQGFGEEYRKEIRGAIIEHIKQRALNNVKAAKKFFRPSLFGGKSIELLAKEVLEGKRDPDIRYLNDLIIEYDPYERAMIRKVVYNELDTNTDSLEEILAMLSALARLNLRFLNKITVLEIDELDADRDAVDFVKAMVNAHISSTVMILITTPALYNKIRDANSSLFDRLEKANYKIDLAGSSTYEEISDIVLEYIRNNVKDLRFEIYEADIVSKLRVIYDEFKEFRNIRSMLNIMYHTMEMASKKGSSVITEEVIEETIKHAYPGLRVKGSIMNVPISEFIRIRREYYGDKLENNVKDAVKSLVMFAHEQGKIKPIENNNTNVDALYADREGRKVGINVMVSKDHAKSIEMISHTSANGIDKLLVLTNAHTYGDNGTTVINIDNCKMIDLIYFSNKYKNEDIEEGDSERALLLAKSVLLY